MIGKYHNPLRVALGGLIIASLLLVVACTEPVKTDATDEIPASELIEGEWKVTKYEITYDVAPNSPIDLTDSSDIIYSFEDGSYSYVCFPACLGITKSGRGTYTVDETHKTIRFTQTHADVEPGYTHLVRQFAELRAKYQFPSRDRLRLDQRMESFLNGEFVQASVVIEAERG